jgi:hypothetical protein
VPSEKVTKLQFSNNGLYLLVMTTAKLLLIYNAFTGETVHSISEFEHDE